MGEFGTMLGMQAPPAPAPAQAPMPFASAVNPTPDPGIHKPASSPQEVESRKAQWTEILQNPNFMRALGVMGAHMMQPIQPGQTGFGQLGTSLGAGITAMQAGEYETYNRSTKERELAMKEAESASRVANTNVGTKTQETALPGVAADADVKVGTAGARIATADVDLDAAKTKAKSAKTAADLADLELAIKTRQKKISDGISDATLLAAEEAKVASAVAALNTERARLGLVNAQTDATKAGGRKTAAEAGQHEVTLDLLNKMPDDEKKQFLTKTGPYATSAVSSGVRQQADMWGQIYDKLPQTDPMKSGKTREQFQMTQLQASKAKDVGETLARLTAAGIDDPEIIGGLADLLKSQISAKKAGTPGKPGDPKSTTVTKEVWTRDKDGKLVKVQQPAAK